jgi:hypothetical protein
MAMIMQEVLRPRAEWIVTRDSAGVARVAAWQAGDPHAVTSAAPHSQIHEHWDATPTRERTLEALHGNKAKRVSSHFLDPTTARAALQAGLGTAQGRALLDAVFGKNAGANSTATMPLDGLGFFAARFVYRSGSGVIRTTEIMRAAGVTAKLIAASPHTAYVQTVFPVAPVDLRTL